jgi:hypothetical protein
MLPIADRVRTARSSPGTHSGQPDLTGSERGHADGRVAHTEPGPRDCPDCVLWCLSYVRLGKDGIALFQVQSCRPQEAYSSERMEVPR